VLALCPRRSPLRAIEGADGVIGVYGSDVSGDALLDAVGPHQRYIALVDDAELLFNGPLSGPFEAILLSGRDGDHGMIMAGATSDLGRAYSGFIPQALKSRCGVLVAVASHADGDLFGVRLPRNAGPGPLGRGLLIRPGSVAPIQLATSE